MKFIGILAVIIVMGAACGGPNEAESTATPSPTQQSISIPTPDPVQLARTGERLAEQIGCIGCHTPDGGTAVGPTWRGLMGSTREFNDGTMQIADSDYIRTSIRDPKAKIVADFLDLMPADLDVSDRDIDAIIAYITTLK